MVFLLGMCNPFASADIGLGIQSETLNGLSMDFGSVTPLGSPFLKPGALSAAVQSSSSGWELTARLIDPLTDLEGGDSIPGLFLCARTGEWVPLSTTQTALLANQPETGSEWRTVPIDAKLEVGWHYSPGSYRGSLVLGLTPGLDQVFASVQPNPFSPNGDGVAESTTVSFHLAQADEVHGSVFDSGGQIVRTLQTQEFLGGFQKLLWDGTSDTGLPVADGVYRMALWDESGGIVADVEIEVDTAAPSLVISEPVHQGIVQSRFRIVGSSEPRAIVKADVVPMGSTGGREYQVRVSQDGSFEMWADAYPGRNQLTITACDLAGNVSVHELEVISEGLSLAVEDKNLIVKESSIQIRGRAPVFAMVGVERNGIRFGQFSADGNGNFNHILTLDPGVNNFLFTADGKEGTTFGAQMNIIRDSHSLDGIALSGCVRDASTGGILENASVLIDGKSVALDGGRFVVSAGDLSEQEEVVVEVMCPNYRPALLKMKADGQAKDIYLERLKAFKLDYTVDRSAEIGGLVWLHVTVENISGQEIEDAVLLFSLPDGWKIDNVAHSLGALLPAERRTIGVPVQVGFGSQLGWNTVKVGVEGRIGSQRVEGGPVGKNILILPGVFDPRGMVLGRVWLDSDNDRVFDREEEVVSGVCMRLENGMWAFSDAAGRFSFSGVLPGTHYAAIDLRGGLPGRPQSRGIFVHVDAGSIVRADFPLSPSLPVAERGEAGCLHGFVSGSTRDSVRQCVDVSSGLTEPGLTLFLNYQDTWLDKYRAALAVGFGGGSDILFLEGQRLESGDESHSGVEQMGPVSFTLQSDLLTFGAGSFETELSVPGAMEYQRQVRGVLGEVKLPSGRLRAFAARETTVRVSESFTVTSAFGPYHLQWSDVLPASLEVELFAEKRPSEMREIPRDSYRFFADTGTLVFERPLPLETAEGDKYLIRVEYEVVTGEGLPQTYGLECRLENQYLNWTGAVIHEGRSDPGEIWLATALGVKLPSSQLNLSLGSSICDGRDASEFEYSRRWDDYHTPKAGLSVGWASEPGSESGMELSYRSQLGAESQEGELSGKFYAGASNTSYSFLWSLRGQDVLDRLSWESEVERDGKRGAVAFSARGSTHSLPELSVRGSRLFNLGTYLALESEVGAVLEEGGLHLPSDILLRLSLAHANNSTLFVRYEPDSEEEVVLGATVAGKSPWKLEARGSFDVHAGRWREVMGFAELSHPITARFGFERLSSGGVNVQLGAGVHGQLGMIDVDAGLAAALNSLSSVKISGAYRPCGSDVLAITGRLDWRRAETSLGAGQHEVLSGRAAVALKPSANWSLGGRLGFRREESNGSFAGAYQFTAYVSHDLTERIQVRLIREDSWLPNFDEYKKTSAVEAGYRVSETLLLLTGLERVSNGGKISPPRLYHRFALAF